MSSDAVTLLAQADHSPNQLVEIEDGTGAGVAMMRSNASNRTTVLLYRGESRTVQVSVAAPTNFEMRVLYSNDGPGTEDILDITVGDQERSLRLPDTRGACGPGDGWNAISAAGPTAPVVQLNAGENTITLTLASADQFGCELDALLLFASGN
jgi:hypothetical protein